MKLARQVIQLFDDYIKSIGFQVLIHFELEGCYAAPSEQHKLNFEAVNRQLQYFNIDGELVSEYWQNQWEYVSKFNGQSPLKEADNLTKAINILPQLFALQGIKQTFIQPVVWSGDQGKLASGCHNIFTDDSRAVHIPNAVQINVSVLDSQGENIIPKCFFGEYLQQCFLQKSLACSLIYLPEEDAFERLALKTKYGLAQELCSPIDISGGHQGSIALYKKLGKHNQKMGVEPLLYDDKNNILANEYNWHKTARIEHRLGASSLDYNAYFNVIFALANVVDALNVYQKKQCQSGLISIADSTALPRSLYSGNIDTGNDADKHGSQENILGAIDLFAKDTWLIECINRVQGLMITQGRISGKTDNDCLRINQLGKHIHQSILAKYQPGIILN